MNEQQMSDMFPDALELLRGQVSTDIAQVKMLVDLDPQEFGGTADYKIWGNNSWEKLKEEYDIDLAKPELEFPIANDTVHYFKTNQPLIFAILRYNKQGELNDPHCQ